MRSRICTSSDSRISSSPHHLVRKSRNSSCTRLQLRHRHRGNAAVVSSGRSGQLRTAHIGRGCAGHRCQAISTHGAQKLYLLERGCTVPWLPSDWGAVPRCNPPPVDIILCLTAQ